MTMFASKDYRSTGSTDRVGDKGPVEKHSISGNAINVWGFVPIGSISRNGLIGMIIREDK